MSDQSEQLKAEQIKSMQKDIEELQTKLDAIKTNVDRGMGIVIGVLAILGVFAGPIVEWVKHLFRVT